VRDARVVARVLHVLRAAHLTPLLDLDPMTHDTTFKTASRLLDHLLDLGCFHPRGGEPPVISCRRVTGRDPLVVVVGDNASGKSLARRVLSSICKENRTEFIGLSMEGRGSYMGGANGLVYGAEAWQSTGENSASTVLAGIRTCRSRERDHVVFWDEPNLGLADGWSAGMGKTIRQFAAEPPEHTLGVFVVTHSKVLVSQLADLAPHFLYFGEEDVPSDLSDWLTRPVVPRDLPALPGLSHDRFLRIQAFLDGNKKKSE
jgi:hypothetical protein